MKKLIALAMALCMVLTMCSFASAAEEKVLIVALGQDPVGYNPTGVTDDYSFQVCSNILSGLITLNANEEIVPDLAKSWEISDDGLTYTFHLNEGVKWHDGVDFTSADVLYTYEKIIAEGAYLAKDLSQVETMECPDDNTIVLTLKAASAPFLASLAWYSNHILPKHIYEQADNWLTCEAATTHPIGTGPFKFVEATSGVNVVLEKNEDYFGGCPKVDKIIYAITPDSDTAYQAFLNGEVDIIENVPTSVVSDLIADDNYSTGCLSAARRFQVCFNMNGDATKDLKLRQAVAMCLDREAISLKATNGLQAPAYGFYPPFLDWAYNSEVDIPARDVEGAKKLLEEIGLTKDAEGNYITLSLLVFTGGSYADCGRVIKNQLAEAGIKVDLQEMEEGAWVERVFSGNFDMCMLAGNQGPDPDNMTNRVGTGGGLNVSFYSNPVVDDLLAQARVAVGNDARGALYKQVQAILAEDLPLMPIVEYASYYACPSYITGVPRIDPTAVNMNNHNYCMVDINN